MADGMILEENTPDEFFGQSADRSARRKEFLESIKGH